MAEISQHSVVMGPYKDTHNHNPPDNPRVSSQSIINSLLTGCVSSATTTILLQPLELIKTQIQTRGRDDSTKTPNKTLGKTTLSTIQLVRQHNLYYLWRGTSASLVRSVPGVGLYYASLNLLQAQLNARPDSYTQAFCLGLTARCSVSVALLPVTVVKVRYESGRYAYTSLSSALKDAYMVTGWVGMLPTLLRDSLFSGVYYMLYSQLKVSSPSSTSTKSHFYMGLASGVIASVVTNPLDVIKTRVQTEPSRGRAIGEIIRADQTRGYSQLFDGLVPRTVRRSLVAASTWTIYEYLIAEPWR